MTIYKTITLQMKVDPGITGLNQTNDAFFTHDYGRAKFVFNLLLNNKPMDITGATAEVVLYMADSSEFAETASVDDPVNGIVSYVLNKNDLSHPGIVNAELNLYFADNTAMAVGQFQFTVKESFKDKYAIKVVQYYDPKLAILSRLGIDANGNLTIDGVIYGGGSAPKTDTTPPNEVTNLQASSITSSTLTLTWTASTSSDIANYDVYQGATKLGTVTGTTYNVSSLAASTSYTFTVKSKDTSGNVSTGVSVTASTTSIPDTIAPNNVTNLQTSNVSTTSLTLVWTASTSSDTVGYDIYNGATLVASTSNISYTITGLSASTQYNFSVKAKDGANNVASGTSVSVTTAAPSPNDTTPPVITASPVGGTFTSGQTVTLSSNETANIYYTLDGSTPTTSSSVYSSPLSIGTTQTLKYFGKDTAGNSSSVQSQSYTINVGISVTGIALDKYVASIDQNTTLQLHATVSPANATNQTVIWSSSSTDLATVDNTGLVTGGGVGTVTITATSQNGAKTASCSITVNQVIIGFDYNNLTAYPSDTPISLDQTVTFGGVGAGDWVHPSLLYFDNGWNGHKYWMGINPYAATNGSTENPFLFYSDDGDNWHTPPGLAEPMNPLASGFGNNSDAHIFMDYDGVTMHYLNRAVYSGTPGQNGVPASTWTSASIIECFSSTDGVTWTPRKTIIDTKNTGYDIVAPSICKVDGTYYMFATDAADQTHLTVLQSDTVYGTWKEINRISTGTLGALWHCEVRYINHEYILVGSTGGIQGGSLMLGKFQTPMDTTMVGRNNVIVIPTGSQYWNKANYKSSLLQYPDGSVDIYVGFKGSALNANTGWRVVRTHATRLSQTLDLSSYTQVDSIADNSGFASTPGKSVSMDYFKYAVDFTITNIANSQVYAFGNSTNQYLKLFMNNGVLQLQLWRPFQNSTGGGVTVTQNISYGLSLNDRITFVQDDNYISTYINGRLIYQFNNNPFQLDLYGLSYGDMGGVVSMKDIKTYKLPQNFYSTTTSNNYKTQVLSEYATTPANFWLYDEFNRANGTVSGSSTNGVAYQVVGTPQISNNALAPGSSSTNAVIVPGYGSMQILTSITSAVNYGIGIYLKYTDLNNYMKLQFSDQGLSFKVCKAGTVTSTSFTKYNINHLNWRFDIVDGVLNYYADGLWMGKANLPNEVFDDKIGISSTNYSGSAIDYIVVKKLTTSDTTPAVITPSLAGGTYTGSQSVTLTSNETSAIYYTIDGSAPVASAASRYSAPITISSSCTLQFFSIDLSGNKSSVQSVSYTIN